ncbi:MAG: fumarylacetoacetase [Acidobacteriota bacterium]|nr:MAG: fumarylacetoacetase [Acidobacteriota bacterium]
MTDRRLNRTHRADLRSFVPVPADSHFPIQNLPFGVFRPRAGSSGRVGVAIGEHVLDLSVIEQAGLLSSAGLAGSSLFRQASLNPFMALGPSAWSSVRARVSELLREDEPTLRDAGVLRDRALLPLRGVELMLPAEIGDYTDFYSSRHHAFNVGSMFRGPDNALMPNWVHLPVAYHGRASSIVVSGTSVHRPKGQTMPEGASRPVYSPSRLVDYELEMGFFVGPGNELGSPIPVEGAANHIFGLVLVNDWSARDIQKWEYQPLGPFLSKNFATSISPWVVTLEALEPFRCAGPVQDPEPLDYLASPGEWSYDIKLEVWLETHGLEQPHRLSLGNFNDLYWNVRQQLAHHTISGCNVRPGDLMASGTISGAAKSSRGCLLELTWRGTEPIELSNGEQRKFLADGDTVIMTGWSEANGYRIGFGECRGKLLPAQL